MTVDVAGNPPQKAKERGKEKARASIQLGNWSFYFFAKFLLFWRELIGLHALENLAFAAFLLVPVTSPAWRRARTAAAIPLAVILLYYDSWLPPLERVWSQASLLSNFSLPYLLELVGRFINWPVVAMLVIGWAGFRIAMRFVRFGLVVVLALAVLAASGGRPQITMANATSSPAVSSQPVAQATSLDPARALAGFYAQEAQRNVKFPKADNGLPFDIIFLHVCSLSWDDLEAIGLDKHPLWTSLDFVFRHFNSAASYSGPAALRINRAPCGQTTHQKLFEPVPDDCYLMPSLKQSGFATNLAFNHDGHFDDFLSLVRKQGVNAPLMPLAGINVPLRAFDNSPVYDDFAVLSRWFEQREKSPEQRVALYYNTISLHDGNRIVSGPNSGLSSKDNFRPRAEKLLNDITGFVEEIEKSGRRAIVVVVPEHGAALRGDKFQIAGLREIPTPSITLVPVGVKVVGKDVTRKGTAAQISESTSYLGLSQLIARLIERSPYGESGFDPAEYVAELPATDYVAENEGIVMLRKGNRYLLKQGKEEWQEIANAAP